MTKLYVPAANTGNVAVMDWFVKDTSVSCVLAKDTFGASPDGLKFWPVIVIRLFK